MYRLLLLPLLCLGLTTCADDDDVVLQNEIDGPAGAIGLNYRFLQDGPLVASYDSLLSALAANPDIVVVAEVDHRANAAIVGESLEPTRVVYFGNPALGTPIMQINQQAGLDLPQRMLLYQTDTKGFVIAHTTSDYLANRHGVGDAPTLATIDRALNELSLTATGISTLVVAGGEVTLNQGVTSFTAAGTVDSVYNNLRTALSANGNISIVAEVDHAANAAAAGLDLPPTRLIIFGNPRLGTPLLQAEQSIGIDLPQKVLVYESAAGEVTVCFNDPAYLAERHGISTTLPEIATIREALTTLSRNALGL